MLLLGGYYFFYDAWAYRSQSVTAKSIPPILYLVIPLPAYFSGPFSAAIYSEIGHFNEIETRSWVADRLLT